MSVFETWFPGLAARRAELRLKKIRAELSAGLLTRRFEEPRAVGAMKVGARRGPMPMPRMPRRLGYCATVHGICAETTLMPSGR